jgi:hypothetical protein
MCWISTETGQSSSVKKLAVEFSNHWRIWRAAGVFTDGAGEDLRGQLRCATTLSQCTPSCRFLSQVLSTCPVKLGPSIAPQSCVDLHHGDDAVPRGASDAQSINRVPGTAPQPQVQTNSSRLALTSEQCAIAPVLQQQVATSETITISVLSDRPGKLSQQIRPPIHGTASNRALPCLQIHDMPMMCKVAIASGVVWPLWSCKGLCV